MVRELYQRLREYFNNLPEPTEEERQFIRELNAGYFPITSVHRDDLEGQGFDVEKISDDDMQNLAEKMADDYCEQLFWPSMEIIAGEILSFPKVKTKDIICPKCNSENIRYDIHESRFHCGECSLAWDDKLYALVEFPEESAPFEEEGTGYPAWGSGENGALYVPEEDYITRVRDNILKSKEQKNIQPTKGGHKMVTCQNYVSLFYRQITSCPSDGGIS